MAAKQSEQKPTREQEVREVCAELEPTGRDDADSWRKIEVILERRRLKENLQADDWDSLLDED